MAGFSADNLALFVSFCAALITVVLTILVFVDQRGALKEIDTIKLSIQQIKNEIDLQKRSGSRADWASARVLQLCRDNTFLIGYITPIIKPNSKAKSRIDQKLDEILREYYELLVLVGSIEERVRAARQLSVAHPDFRTLEVLRLVLEKGDLGVGSNEVEKLTSSLRSKLVPTKLVDSRVWTGRY